MGMCTCLDLMLHILILLSLPGEFDDISENQLRAYEGEIKKEVRTVF